jgi:hypothetical protein
MENFEVMGFRVGEECRCFKFNGAGMADGEGMMNETGTSAGSSLLSSTGGTTGEGMVSSW